MYAETERYKLWSKIDLEHERVQEVIDLAIRNNVIFSPTLALFERREGEEDVEDFHVEGFRNMMKFTEMAYRAGHEHSKRFTRLWYFVMPISGGRTNGKWRLLTEAGTESAGSDQQ
jgi:hypothetical protein